MMIANCQRLFLVERKIADKICKQCKEKIPKHDVCFSKKNKQYYCLTCALALGYVKLKDPRKIYLEGQLVGA